jgi:hypothetical protein
MVSQKQLRFDIYDELEQITSGVVDTANITDTQPHKREDFPAVVHSYEIRERPLNRGGAAPVRTRYTNNEADAFIYNTVHVASFTITVAATSKETESTIHTSIKNHFDAFTKDRVSPTSINSDITAITVGDSTEVNVPERAIKVYAHQFTIEVEFVREYADSVDPIRTVNEETTIGGN